MAGTKRICCILPIFLYFGREIYLGIADYAESCGRWELAVRSDEAEIAPAEAEGFDGVVLGAPRTALVGSLTKKRGQGRKGVRNLFRAVFWVGHADGG